MEQGAPGVSARDASRTRRAVLDAGHLGLHLPLGIIVLFGALGLISMAFGGHPRTPSAADAADA